MLSTSDHRILSKRLLAIEEEIEQIRSLLREHLPGWDSTHPSKTKNTIAITASSVIRLRSELSLLLLSEQPDRTPFYILREIYYEGF